MLSEKDIATLCADAYLRGFQDAIKVLQTGITSLDRDNLISDITRNAYAIKDTEDTNNAKRKRH